MRAWAIATLIVVAGLLLPGSALAATAPSVVGSIGNATNLSGSDAVAVSGQYAYSTAYWPGQLTAVNIANPIAPTVANSTATSSSLENASNIAIAGPYAYVVSKNRNGTCQPGPVPNCNSGSNDDGSGNSLTVVDISSPGTPVTKGFVTSLTELFGAYGVAVSGSYAYVAYQGVLTPTGQPGTPGTSNGGFSVINISNPLAPAIVGNIDNGPVVGGHNYLRHATSVAISGHYAYVTADYDDRLTVIDISNPTNPLIVTSLRDAVNMPGPVDVAVSGNYAYVASQSGSMSTQLAVVNIANPASPVIVGSLSNSMLAGAYRIRVHNNFVYISAASASAIDAVDVSNPAAPRLAGVVQDPAHLNVTTGLDLNSAGDTVIAASPQTLSENSLNSPPYPPFTHTTGTISEVQLDPNLIGVTITPASEPPSSTTSTSASFAFSVNDDVSTVACSIDGGSLGPCTSPTTAQYGALSAGVHTFAVVATDAAGNQAHDSYTWAIDGAPANTSAPRIGGQALLGRTLSAIPGGWTGYPAPAFSYQWQRCDQTGANCGVIAGATMASYTLQAADVSRTVRAIVTGTNATGSAAAPSSATPPIRSMPSALTQPKISGTAMQGSTLSAGRGTWSGYPTPTLRDQWQRCNRTASACADIPGATATTYVPTGNDVGSKLRLVVKATNAAGSNTAQSGVTAVVVSNVVAWFSGIARGAPALHVTVTAAGNGARVKQITVSLPSTIMRFSAATARQLAASVVVRDGANKRLRVQVGLRSGSLVITLRKPTTKVRILVGGRVVVIKNSFVQRTKRKKKPTATLVLLVMETQGVHTHDQTQARASRVGRDADTIMTEAVSVTAKRDTP